MMESANPAFAHELNNVQNMGSANKPNVPTRTGGGGGVSKYGGMGQRMSRALGLGGNLKGGLPPPEPDI
jgi:hypothetical protein